MGSYFIESFGGYRASCLPRVPSSTQSVNESWIQHYRTLPVTTVDVDPVQYAFLVWKPRYVPRLELLPNPRQNDSRSPGQQAPVSPDRWSVTSKAVPYE